MAEVTRHVQGEPCWAELSTTDEDGALRFYGRLFGWEDKPQTMGPGRLYHMQRVRGLEAAAIFQQSEEEKKQRVPTCWRTYFAVDSADEAAKRVKASGGTVLAGPFDVMEAGCMTMVQDPPGAIVALWQARKHPGYRIVSEPGAVTWNELLTTDSKAAAGFYEKVLGVRAEKMEGALDYTLLKVNGRDMAGIMDITKEMGPLPPAWSVFFFVSDVDSSAVKARSLGAKVLAGPRDIAAVGRFAALQDPQGAGFNIFYSKGPQG